MINIGILGTGFGAEHLKQYSKISGTSVRRIFGRNTEKLGDIESGYGVSVTTSIDDILSDPDIDLIDICLPTILHAEFITKALGRGKNVICETPLCYSIEDAERIGAAVKQSPARLFNGLFIKFSPPHALALERARSEKMGDVLSVTAYQKTPPHWGDMKVPSLIQELARHNIDFIIELMGAPADISVTGIETGNSHFLGSLKYETGFAQFECSTLVPKSSPFSMGYDITFENGRIVFNGNYGMQVEEKCVLYTDEAETVIDVPEIEGHPEVIRKVLSYVTDCIENEREDPLLNFDKACASVKTVNSVLEKWKTK